MSRKKNSALLMVFGILAMGLISSSHAIERSNRDWSSSVLTGNTISSSPATCNRSCMMDYGDDGDDSFFFRYNRVDGLVVGISKSREIYRRRGGLQLYGMAGVGLKSRRFQYRAVLERSFFPIDFQFAIGGEAYDMTHTEDLWIIPAMENSLAAMLIHEDFHDYYRRKGYGGYIMQNFGRHLVVKAGYYEEEHQNLEVTTNWSLFGGKKKFRPNPPIDEISLKGIYGRVCLDTRNRQRAPRRGWLVQIMAEYFPADLNNLPAYERYILDIRRYQPISRGENLNFRFRIGETAGTVPIQKYFDLGGISTLRAYDYKSFTGTRMVLANLEYHINWDRLDWYPDIPFLDMIDLFNLILFVDAGLAWERSEKDFQKLHAEDLRSDVGIAFANDDGTVRLNIAKRTDRSTDAVRVTFRISRPF